MGNKRKIMIITFLYNRGATCNCFDCGYCFERYRALPPDPLQVLPTTLFLSSKRITLSLPGGLYHGYEWKGQADRNHYLGHSYVFLIAAVWAWTYLDGRFFNRGVSESSGDLRKRWQKDAVEMRPDWLSILVSVNDISRGERSSLNFDKWEEDYRLFRSCCEANPKLQLC